MSSSSLNSEKISFTFEILKKKGKMEKKENSATNMITTSLDEHSEAQEITFPEVINLSFPDKPIKSSKLLLTSIFK